MTDAFGEYDIHLKYPKIEEQISQKLPELQSHFDSEIDTVLYEVDSNLLPAFTNLARHILTGIDSIKRDRPQSVAIGWRAYSLGQVIASWSMTDHFPKADIGGLISDCRSTDSLFHEIYFGSKAAIETSPNYSKLIERYRSNIDPDNEEPVIVDLFAGLSLFAMNRAEYMRAKELDTENALLELGKIALASNEDWDSALDKLLQD